jgi:hypothetical protein
VSKRTSLSAGPRPENAREARGELTPGAKRHHVHGRARRVHPSLKKGGLAREIVNFCWPHGVHQYPGKVAMLAAACGVSRNVAKHYLRERDPLPVHAAKALAGYLRGRAREAERLAQALGEFLTEREPVATRPRGFMASRRVSRWSRR